MATTSTCRTLPRALRCAKVPSAARPRRRITTAAIEHGQSDPYLPETVLPPPLPTPPASRREAIREAKPFSDFLTDTLNRQHDYLRISVTERCNLRCLYCMPEEGIQLSPNKELLTTAEIYYLSALFVNQGVNKIRLTGGEPTVRKDIVPMMQQIGSLRRKGLKELALTTNGISLHRKLDAMVEAGLTGVNISLDTLDPFQFQLLTRRQGFDAVMKSINRVQEMNKLGARIKLKINAVVMRGVNDHQILPFVDMTQDQDIEVRFIEYMPFGGNKWSQNKMLPYSEMLDMIREKYPMFARLKDAKNDTSKTWQVPGFVGRVGFITSMTHDFCGTCNRLRITSDGNLKVCLHGEAEVSLRDLLRKENGGEPMDEEAFEAVRQIELDRRKSNTLTWDGEERWLKKEVQLLEVIGAAVKRKKPGHAGMGELENMKNRPMILIGEQHRKTERRALRQRCVSKRLSPSRTWSRLPLHLLAPHSLHDTQVRFYSSGSDDQQSQKDDAKFTDETTKPSPQPFGFQSLSGLFQRPLQNRYSRPREPLDQRASEEPKVGLERPGPAGSVGATFFRSSTEGPPQGLQSKEASDGNDSRQQVATAPAHEYETGLHTTANPAILANSSVKTESGTLKSVGRRVRSRQPSLIRPIRDIKKVSPLFLRPRRQEEAVRQRAIRVPNPYVSPESHRGTPAKRISSRAVTPTRPWGLVDQKLQQYAQNADGQTSGATHGEDDDLPESATPLSIKAYWSTENLGQPARALTHVKSSGEAHMVDVGDKAATKRVAIAFGTVRFSNTEPFRLILENNNKKGDVLGVARIAGIMAAKRTSDLIPLCHPIALTKVEVDLKLEPAGVKHPLWNRNNNYGIVTVQALVECTGPTGVEMEALTAVSGASLTIYDMCKAVDKHMNLVRTSVVYKSGGRSGLFLSKEWLSHCGKELLASRGLEAPSPRQGKEKSEEEMMARERDDESTD